ncbi:hypothetical protein B0H17DRAFT_1067671 [Mycena rosella]|uniref:Zn(2)-C6 fungal-type domain-containing protein n=1 Tax=Mycena rosella TaxID=1033263 RepID=A0AAD7DDK9_MYCRO|nr:hypothetical protein B0H17DRAFT_1067671 [Mycena rosella]
MPTPRIREKRRPKPPACNSCKAPIRRPCPRCAEKNLVCTTTPVPRGRPRKNPVPDPQSPPQQELVCYAPSSSSMTPAECPDLTPQLVSHFFQCFDQLAQVLNPVTRATSINTRIRAVSFQLCLLPPQCRVLALCIIAFSSLVSYHEVMLGDGPRPESFYDRAFFASKSNVRGCGARRSAVHRALHTMALKAAWDCGIMLEVSNENTASCFLLDLIAQGDVCSTSRPWASAYISHLRALAPSWRTFGAPPASGSHWAGVLVRFPGP